MQLGLWSGAAGAVLVALASGWGEHRRRERRELDRVGWVPWQAVQLVAMVMALVLVSVALNLKNG
jgi:hypothetical protein